MWEYPFWPTLSLNLPDILKTMENTNDFGPCDLIPGPHAFQSIVVYLVLLYATSHPKSPGLANYPIMNTAHTAIRICAQEMRDRKIRSNPSRPHPHQNKSMRCEEENGKEEKTIVQKTNHENDPWCRDPPHRRCRRGSCDVAMNDSPLMTVGVLMGSWG